MQAYLNPQGKKNIKLHTLLMKWRVIIKRLLIFTLVFALLISFVACAGRTEDDSSDSTTTQNTTTTTKVETTTTIENPFTEHLQLTYLVAFALGYEEGRWDELELEEKFNIDLKVWTIDAESSEQCTLMAAAGDWPDTEHVAAYSPNRAYDEGLIRSISLEQIRTMLPEYYGILESNPIGFKINQIQDKPGHYYGLSFCYSQNNYWYHVNCFRLDWLENIGYSINDLTEVIFTDDLMKEADDVVYLSNRVFTYEEFKDIMRAFTEEDPDGNGNDDTYGAMFPLYGPSFGSTWTDLYTGMFGITKSYSTWLYYEKDTGDYVPPYAYHGWRDFLVFINEMLTKGYMTYMPDIANGDYLSNFYGNILTCQYGHFPLDTKFNMNPGASDPPIESGIPLGMMKKDPDVRLVIVPAILGPDGVGGNARYVDLPFRDGSWGTWTFGIGCTDEKLERALALMRYTHFTDEGFYRYYYGIEGIHFRWTGEPYNSAAARIDRSKIPREYAVTAVQDIFATDKFLADFRKWSMIGEFFYQLGNYQIDNGWYLNYTLEPDKLIHRLYMGDELYEEYIDLYNEIGNDIITVASDFRNKAFRGELANINAEWQNYIETLYNAGLKQLVEIFNREDFGLYDIDKTALYQ
jgi:hypothetical protein